MNRTPTSGAVAPAWLAEAAPGSCGTRIGGRPPPPLRSGRFSQPAGQCPCGTAPHAWKQHGIGRFHGFDPTSGRQRPPFSEASTGKRSTPWRPTRVVRRIVALRAMRATCGTALSVRF